MDDNTLISLFFNRDQTAIETAAKQYGGYCRTIADNILHSSQDTEECLNDVWLSVWNSIPPDHPDSFGSYVGRITRNRALDLLRQRQARKRGGGQTDTAIEELQQIIPSGDLPEQHLQGRELAELLNSFLRSLSLRQRRVFLLRYWYFCSEAEIARRLGMTRGGVSASLARTRKKLRTVLKEAEYDV